MHNTWDMTIEFRECLSSSHLSEFGLPCTRSHPCDWGASGVVTIADGTWFTAEWGSAVCSTVCPSPSTSHRKQPRLTSPSLVSICRISPCNLGAVHNKRLERLMRVIQQPERVQDLKVLTGCYTGYHCQCTAAALYTLNSYSNSTRLYIGARLVSHYHQNTCNSEYVQQRAKIIPNPNLTTSTAHS